MTVFELKQILEGYGDEFDNEEVVVGTWAAFSPTAVFLPIEACDVEYDDEGKSFTCFWTE